MTPAEHIDAAERLVERAGQHTVNGQRVPIEERIVMLERASAHLKIAEAKWIHGK